MALPEAILIFVSAMAYFYLLLFTLLPFVKKQFAVNPALYWFIIGFSVFIPLFCYALAGVRREGNGTFRQILESLNIRALSKRDWKYAVIGLFLTFLLTGAVFGMSFLLTRHYGVRPLTTTPWFMEIHPFQGIEKLLLLVWFPMFFFNIVGEEILWRGYIQNRLQTKYPWQFCSVLWMVFHVPFGLDLMLMLIPIIIIIPYIFHKTENTSIGIFIHGLYNGPTFVAVALGLLH
ncbi:MAG: CPBP family intramembrane metalloprotease [Deltaproteobacteria bacterium]|nr:CPBP family intramembrane metalloprotease [Deltaproteobacteria bacterium]